ncbi:MAG: transketolase [Candidatus Paceibacterota bacterium]|jgi:transketolase|nr:transketolase [Candidatus Paceibacterota bacterium]
MSDILNEDQIRSLKEKSRDIRVSVVEMLAEAKSGHTAGSLGMADIFAYLYFHALKHDPKDPAWEERDRLVLSNGHICPVLYSAMAHAGYFPTEELLTLRKFGSRLQGHPHREFLPMAETSSGPLGEGLSQAVGMALAFRMDKKENRVYCLMGDGELDEGQVWEAAMQAGKEKLAKITALVDRNNIQIDGTTDQVMPLEPLKTKWESFGWHTIEIDGHNLQAIHSAVQEAHEISDKPSVIIARTVSGKGVPEIEGSYRWHGKAPDKEEAERFVSAIKMQNRE